MTDTISTITGNIFGTSPLAIFVESASGVATGGRTGLTALVVAILFAIILFFHLYF
jgi:AGZA family xanthine/uracil permease-like MFS transporter